LDGSGNIYVVDSENNRIQEFSPYMIYLGQWGGLGTGNGQLYDPSTVVVDGSGNVYVADYGNLTIEKFGT
jgi:DNA-binding beta-propeller fold protein YncE